MDESKDEYDIYGQYVRIKSSTKRDRHNTGQGLYRGVKGYLFEAIFWTILSFIHIRIQRIFLRRLSRVPYNSEHFCGA